MATVYGIVKQNNGFINVYSEPGLGTTFNIYLPLHIAEEGEIDAEKITEIPLGHGETILVVEDEIAVLGLARTMLVKLGYTVLTSNTPGEALRLAEEYGDTINLLLTDVVMPEMNDRDLASQLKLIYPGTRYCLCPGTRLILSHIGGYWTKEWILLKSLSLLEILQIK